VKGAPTVPIPVPPVPLAPGAPIPIKSGICDKYATALNITGRTLVTSIVTKTVGKEVGDPLTKPFFDGTTPSGSTNFLDPKNKPALDGLVEGLVRFFGVALGCTDNSIPPYNGRDLASIHANMHIPLEVQLRFNSLLLDVLRESNVTADDITGVGSVLNSLNSAITGQPEQQNPFILPPQDPDFKGPGQVHPGVVAVAVIFAITGALIVGGVMSAVIVSISTVEPKFDAYEAL